MLEILQFIFSDFWIWLGTFLLLAVVCNGLAHLIHGYPPNIIKKGEDDD